jgi:hypothetical protein
MDLLVVISKYREDVTWVENLSFPYLIYNKYEDDNDYYTHNLVNLGREGHTFMHHIVENYNNLNEYTAFVQGNPFDHCPNFIEIVNNFKGDVDLVGLGRKVIYGSQTDEIGEQIINFSELIGFTPSFPVQEVSGGQIIIHKNVILSKNKDFYQRIVDSLLDEQRTRRSGYDLEKTTFQIFDKTEPVRWEY